MESLIKNRAIVLNFTINVTEGNVNILKRLPFAVIDKNIEIGEEIDVNYSLEGELSDSALNIAMLFNSSLVGKPKLSLCRN